MKKKILLNLTIMLAVVFGISSVKALEITYPDYGNKIIYDEEINKVCSVEDGEFCIEYDLQEDSEDSSKIKLINGETILTRDKSDISGGYIVVSDKYYDEKLMGEECNDENCGDGDPRYTPGVKYIVYYKFNEIAPNILEIANDYANSGYYATIRHKQYNSFSYACNEEPGITISKNVTLIAEDININGYIINNGFIKTGSIVSTNISGKGNINLVYSTEFFRGPDEYDNEDFNRLFFVSITGVKFDISGKEIKEGLQVGIFGRTDVVTKEDAQKIVDMLNKVKGDTLKDYTISLSEYYTDEYNGTVYIGILKKNPEVKQEVNNPKTGDSLFKILGLITISGMGIVATLKKLRYNK